MRFRHDSRKYILTVDGTPEVEVVTERMETAIRKLGQFAGLDLDSYVRPEYNLYSQC